MRAFLERHRYDVIVFLAFLVIGLSVLFVTLKFSPEGDYVKITKGDGEAVYLPLYEDGEYILPDGKNTVVTESGRAYMREADCPDRLCVKTGRIRSVGERIICLPNKVVIEVIRK